MRFRLIALTLVAAFLATACASVPTVQRPLASAQTGGSVQPSASGAPAPVQSVSASASASSSPVAPASTATAVASGSPSAAADTAAPATPTATTPPATVAPTAAPTASPSPSPSPSASPSSAPTQTPAASGTPAPTIPHPSVPVTPFPTPFPQTPSPAPTPTPSPSPTAATPTPGSGGTCPTQVPAGQTCFTGTLVFASGAPAPGVCVQQSTASSCLALSDAQGAWRGVVADNPAPTLLYLYLGVEKGRQTPTSSQLVSGGTVSLGRYVLAP